MSETLLFNLFYFFHLLVALQFFLHDCKISKFDI